MAKAKGEFADVKALLFDVFGTVVDWRGGVARDVRTLAAKINREIDAEAFADDWRLLYMPAMEDVRAGRRPFVKLDVLHRENLEKVLVKHGIPGKNAIGGLSEEQIDWLNRCWHRLDPWQDSVEGLKRLKAKFIIAPQSNGNIALITNMAKRAGLPWDVVLGAEVVQHYKPCPAAYSLAAERLGLKPEECMMVAAHNGDLLAAKKQGLRTAFVVRPQEFGPMTNRLRHFAGRTPLADPTPYRIDLGPAPEIDVSATSFVELAGKIGA